MLFICYPKCTTCRKAERYLLEHGIEFSLRDIVLERPSKDELAFWQSKSGLPLRRFFNTSGMKYREMGLKDKLAAMSTDEQLELLSSDGMLVKRPLLIADDYVLVGFKESEWSDRLS